MPSTIVGEQVCENREKSSVDGTTQVQAGIGKGVPSTQLKGAFSLKVQFVAGFFCFTRKVKNREGSGSISLCVSSQKGLSRWHNSICKIANLDGDGSHKTQHRWRKAR